jgi:hypothetical protein
MKPSLKIYIYYALTFAFVVHTQILTGTITDNKKKFGELK